MTTDKAAQQYFNCVHNDEYDPPCVKCFDELIESVAAIEREACASIALAEGNDCEAVCDETGQKVASIIEFRIRARSQKSESAKA